MTVYGGKFLSTPVFWLFALDALFVERAMSWGTSAQRIHLFSAKKYYIQNYGYTLSTGCLFSVLELHEPDPYSPAHLHGLPFLHSHLVSVHLAHSKRFLDQQSTEIVPYLFRLFSCLIWRDTHIFFLLLFFLMVLFFLFIIFSTLKQKFVQVTSQNGVNSPISKIFLY